LLQQHIVWLLGSVQDINNIGSRGGNNNNTGSTIKPGTKMMTLAASDIIRRDDDKESGDAQQGHQQLAPEARTPTGDQQ
jgi:hypothetical protein